MLSTTGIFLRDHTAGTPLYMSPESLQELPVTAKADVYSYALILNYLLTGVEPYNHITTIEALKDHVVLQDERTPISHRAPESVRKLIEDCWDADPDRRYSFAYISKMLSRAKTTLMIPHPQARRFWRSCIDADEIGLELFFAELVHYLGLEDEDSALCNIALEIMQMLFGETLTIENFGLIICWFGPLETDDDNLLNRIHDYAKHPYFYDYISSKKARALLNGEKTGKLILYGLILGTFLVRLNKGSFEKPTSQEPYRISVVVKIDGKKRVLHYVVHFDEKNQCYYIYTKQLGRLEGRDIVQIVQNHWKQLKLSKPTQQNPFKSAFDKYDDSVYAE